MLAIDDRIELSFDRFLDPLTVTRQSVALRDEFNQAPVNPTVSYDPVRRVVVLANPSTSKPWLVAGQPYKLVIPAPAAPDDLSLRAIDGAGLAKTVVIGFFAAPARGVAPEPQVSFCRDVFPILRACKLCHGAPAAGRPVAAIAGLVLETESGIAATARGRVANATNTGARSTAAPPGTAFGIDMPIIDPGNPGNSFLLYKLVQRPPTANAWATEPCSNAALVPTWDVATMPRSGDAETQRLAQFIPGMSMPFRAASDTTTADTTVSDAELDRLRLWIAQGANVESCNGTCAP